MRSELLFIMDDVPESEPSWVENLLELFYLLCVFFLNFHRQLVELEKREKERKSISHLRSIYSCSDIEMINGFILSRIVQITNKIFIANPEKNLNAIMNEV